MECNEGRGKVWAPEWVGRFWWWAWLSGWAWSGGECRDRLVEWAGPRRRRLRGCGEPSGRGSRSRWAWRAHLAPPLPALLPVLPLLLLEQLAYLPLMLTPEPAAPSGGAGTRQGPQSAPAGPGARPRPASRVPPLTASAPAPARPAPEPPRPGRRTRASARPRRGPGARAARAAAASTGRAPPAACGGIGGLQRVAGAPGWASGGPRRLGWACDASCVRARVAGAARPDEAPPRAARLPARPPPQLQPEVQCKCCGKSRRPALG